MSAADDRPLPQSTSRLEVEIVRFQYAQIRRLFGREVAERANYGWAIDASEESLEVSTKVYGPSTVLTTTISTSLVDWPEGGSE